MLGALPRRTLSSSTEGWDVLSLFSASCADMTAPVTGHYSHTICCARSVCLSRQRRLKVMLGALPKRTLSSSTEGWDMLSLFSASCADMTAPVTSHYPHCSLCTQQLPV